MQRNWQALALILRPSSMSYSEASHGARETSEDRAQRYGFEYLGGGAYGAAYLCKHTGKVLKVSRSVRDGTMGFIARCAEHYRKTGEAFEGTPKVFEFGQARSFWYSVMEYVQPHVDMPWDCDEPPHTDWFEGRVMAFLGDDLSNRVYFDTHSGNYGQTDDGRWVVFDPMGVSNRVKKFPKHVKQARVYGPQR